MKVYVFGASDDIVCVDTDKGFIEHFDAFDGGVVVHLEHGDERLSINAIFTHDGKWIFSPLPSHDNADWAVASANGGRKLGVMPWTGEAGESYGDFSPIARAAEHTQVLIIDVPDGTTARMTDGVDHRSQKAYAIT
jgi:hypothetical protein